MEEFLKAFFSSVSNLKKEPLKGDGGHRLYVRLRQEEKTFMLMSCGVEDPSLKLFVEIQKRLNPFVLVPKIFHLDLNKGLLLLEDLGDESLEKVFFTKKKSDILSFYEQALKQLICLQGQVLCLDKDPIFKAEFFLNEMKQAILDIEKYFCDFLNGCPFDKGLLKEFNQELKELVDALPLEESVYCHRDYHSRNLMITNGKVVMIDFQDAGKGPWCYDLSSLLYDSYTSLEEKDKLAQFYFDNLSPALKEKVKSFERVKKMVRLQFLQRGFKACGRFCAFKIEDNKQTHLKYLKPSFMLLKSTAEEMSYPSISKLAGGLIQALPAK